MAMIEKEMKESNRNGCNMKSSQKNPLDVSRIYTTRPSYYNADKGSGKNTKYIYFLNINIVTDNCYQSALVT